tara:strand:- start:42 stop:494 length:453 start_codon:yes stop_codon:yes gene_type:complete
MKFLLLTFIFFFLTNCSINRISNTHGFKFIEKKYENIEINKTNKNDIRKIIGPPSSISKFDDIWFYIERKKTNQSLLKLGKKKISRNNIVIIRFNKRGVVSNKDILDLSNMNDIEISKMKTNKKFGQNTFVYDLLSTLREKINAPSRRAK